MYPDILIAIRYLSNCSFRAGVGMGEPWLNKCIDLEITETSNFYNYLSQLFDNQIGSVRIHNFFDLNACSSAVSNILKAGFGFYEDVVPPIGRIGITQFEHTNDEDSKYNYFNKVTIADSNYSKIFENLHSPVDEVTKFLGSFYKTSVAVEDTDKKYFTGLLRIVSEALLHCDWAPRDAPGWSIADINAQISWNIYLQTAEMGGESEVFNRQWQNGDDSFMIQDSYGYDRDIVQGCESVVLKPETGDLIFINSRNFHTVRNCEQAESMRVTCSSFAGRKSNNVLKFWS